MDIDTAKKIATECGIMGPDDLAMEASEFRMMKADDYSSLKRLRVLARSTPMDKKTLVSRLKTLGEVVAVTGDGTNDGTYHLISDSFQHQLLRRLMLALPWE